MLSILPALFTDAEYVRGNVTFHIDNPNCRDALVRGIPRRRRSAEWSSYFGIMLKN